MTDVQILELKIYNTIAKMEESVQPVFKNLALISDEMAELSKQHDEDSRKVDLDFEEQLKPLFELRNKILNGEDVDLDLADYDKRLEQIKDDKYEKVEVEPSDLKHLESVQGIPDFWYVALKNHKTLGANLCSLDEGPLKALKFIEAQLQPNSKDFSLKFHFGENEYFTNDVIRKRYIMEEHEKCTKIECSSIAWKAGKDLSKSNLDEDVFMRDFFVDKVIEEEETSSSPRMDLHEDYDLAVELKEDFLPLALEYYLNLMEHPIPEGEGDED